MASITNFNYAQNKEIYKVQNDVKPGVVQIKLYNEEQFEIDLSGMAYMVVQPNIGIDKDGVFALCAETIRMMQRSRPFARIFDEGQRRCFQCEYDEFCFNNKENERIEAYRHILDQGNWT